MRSGLQQICRRYSKVCPGLAVAYAVAAWLLIQIATQVFPFLEIPKLSGILSVAAKE
jgi:hypothetical protein